MRLVYRAGVSVLMVVASAVASADAPERLGAWTVSAVASAGSVRAVSSSEPGDNWGTVKTHRSWHECVPLVLETTDYFVDVTSTLPNHSGLPAIIEVRRVRPIYHTGRCRRQVRSAVLVHGRTTARRLWPPRPCAPRARPGGTAGTTSRIPSGLLVWQQPSTL